MERLEKNDVLFFIHAHNSSGSCFNISRLFRMMEMFWRSNTFLLSFFISAYMYAGKELNGRKHAMKAFDVFLKRYMLDAHIYWCISSKKWWRIYRLKQKIFFSYISSLMERCGSTFISSNYMLTLFTCFVIYLRCIYEYVLS